MLNPENKSRQRRLLICEEALKDFNGHWYEYNKAVAEMNLAEGTQVTVLGHRELSPEIADELPAIPFFEQTNWDGIYYHRKAWRRYIGILIHNWRVYRAVSLYLRRESTPYDCAFAPTVVIFHLIAWWFIAHRFDGSKVKRIVLLIRNSSTSYDTGDDITFSRSARILGFVLKRFHRFTKSGLVEFATDSHRLAAEYHKLAGIEMSVLPHPSCLAKAAPSLHSRPDSDSTFTLISPGPARWEKGIHILLDSMGYLSNESIECLIQWPDPVLSPEGEEVTTSLKSCHLFRDPLSSEDYESFLEKADCIVLPYLREAYFARISGVAVEAMLLGIPVIYTNDTWIGDMVEKYGAGLGFPSGDAEVLASAIQSVAEAPAKWKSEAADRTGAARTYFSSETFQNLLWGNQRRPI